MSEQRSPAELMEELNTARNKVVQLGEQYSLARTEKGAIEYTYEMARAKVFVDLYEKSLNGEIKMPAEDVRKALAIAFIEDPTVYETYITTTAEVDSLEKLIRVQQSNLSGLQTELQQLRVEYTHA